MASDENIEAMVEMLTRVVSEGTAKIFSQNIMKLLEKLERQELNIGSKIKK